MKATDRQRARHQAIVDSPMEGENVHVYGDDVYGDVSDDLAKYLPLAAGVATELTVDQLKKKEAADKAKAAANSDAGKSQAAAKDARTRAAMLQADAIKETDPSGPMHKMAAQAELDARAAEAKAGYFNQAAGPAAMPTGMMPAGYGAPMAHGGSTFFTPTNIMIGVGVLGVGTLAVLMLRKRR